MRFAVNRGGNSAEGAIRAQSGVKIGFRSKLVGTRSAPRWHPGVLKPQIRRFGVRIIFDVPASRQYSMTAPTPNLVRCLTVEEVHDLPVSPALITCAANLLEHEFPEPEVSMCVSHYLITSVPDETTICSFLYSAHYPESLSVRKLAAVLVLLYERDGQIRVLLTTRSKQLRSHPGQTALPGGRSEQDDGSPFITAVSSFRFFMMPCIVDIRKSSERRTKKSPYL